MTRPVHEIIAGCCEQFRKGPAVVESEEHGIAVTEVFAMAPATQMPPGWVGVDVEFILIGVDKAKAERVRAELREALTPHRDRLKQGPSYIEIGGWVGDQGVALCLLAVGEVLGFWTVVTPAKLGLPEPFRAHAAGNGYVMASGYNEEDPVDA